MPCQKSRLMTSCERKFPANWTRGRKRRTPLYNNGQRTADRGSTSPSAQQPLQQGTLTMKTIISIAVMVALATVCAAKTAPLAPRGIVKNFETVHPQVIQKSRHARNVSFIWVKSKLCSIIYIIITIIYVIQVLTASLLLCMALKFNSCSLILAGTSR
jgi:hypothetical protein